MRMRLLPVGLILSAIMWVWPASADITRTCKASIDVYVNNNGPNWSVSLGEVIGQGSCSGKLKANECRSRARSALDACLRDLWAGRQVNAIPASCRSLVAGSSRSGARLQYDGITTIAEPNRLMARVAASTCCRQPRPDKLTVQVNGRITGDKNCAATKIGKDRFQDEYGFPKYDMNCAAWRAQGICGK